MKSYVMITGASGGVGKAFCAECAARGWDLFITDLSTELLTPLAAGLERLYGVEVLQHPCNLTDSASRDTLWQHIASTGIQFHFLINVAGVEYEGPFSERQVDELRSIIRLNIESTVENTRRVLQYRDPTRPLHIINVSSMASFSPMPIKAVYAASKRFLLDFSQALNQELHLHNVTVTALCPAGMPTTPQIIRRIDAQGFLGKITTLNVGEVASKAIIAALAGRPVVVPGLINQFGRLLSRLLPSAIKTAIIKRRWTAAYKKTLAAPAVPGKTPAAPSARSLR